MKPSVGIRTLSVLLILGGGARLLLIMAWFAVPLIGVVLPISQPKEVDRTVLEYVAKAKERNAPSGHIEIMRQAGRRLKEAIYELRTSSRSPTLLVWITANIILGLMTIVAGAGALLLRRWALQLTFSQAILAACLAFIDQGGLGIASLNRRLAQSMDNYFTASSDFTVAMTTPSVIAQRSGAASTPHPAAPPEDPMGRSVINTFFAVAWNMFILWFFSRKSIKSQFRNSGGRGIPKTGAVLTSDAARCQAPGDRHPTRVV